MEINQVLKRLKGVKRTGRGQWLARCCVHDDRQPSLSVRELNGRVLLHCFAGCDYESLKSALGLNGSSAPYVPPVPVRQVPDCQINFDLLWKRHSERTTPDRISSLAENLGVESQALDMIGCVWVPEHCAYGFPMKDGATKIIGMRLRNSEGKKWAIKGSKSGLFIPAEFTESTVFIAEGPTDVAAGLSLGLHVIGRPACLGQEEMVAHYIRLFQFKRAVIVSDDDGPGFRGATKLQSTLRVPSALFIPPCKDLRQFVSLGGNAEMIRSTLRDLTWQMPSTSSRRCA